MINALYRHPGVRLEDVVSAGPVERGLYVVMGGEGVVRELEGRLLDVLESEFQERRTPILHTPSDARPWRRASCIGSIIWIDAAEEFHRIRFELSARRRGLDADRTLRAIRLEEANSVGDLNDRLARVPNPALLASDGAVWWTPFVVVTGLASLFPDTLSDELAAEQFHELTVRLAHLRRRAVVIATWAPQAVSPRQRVILQALLNLGRRVMTRAEAENVMGLSAGSAVREPILLARTAAA